jgi:hypothetical protein
MKVNGMCPITISNVHGLTSHFYHVYRISKLGGSDVMYIYTEFIVQDLKITQQRAKMPPFLVVASCSWQKFTKVREVLPANFAHLCHLVVFSAKRRLYIVITIWFRKICRNLRYAWSLLVIFVLLSFPRNALPVASCHVIQQSVSTCMIQRIAHTLYLLSASVSHRANL